MILKKLVPLFAVFVLLINLASAQFFYDNSYDSFGFFGSGAGDILFFYESNAGWIDFFIFLLIFMGLTQAVFSTSHLKGQAKSLAIGLSLALSFGLMIWERNTGINLLAFGPVAFLILSILIFYVVFSLLKKMGTEKWVAGAWGYVAAYALVMIFSAPLLRFLANTNLLPILNLLFWLAVIGGVIGLFFETNPHARIGP
ncbi:hypothetical protein HYX16_04600 [Candidatus Woesearchaeota archaeon]|nr:hypothetical protein [Candidatus Woesearchaeota archaeon]